MWMGTQCIKMQSMQKHKGEGMETNRSSVLTLLKQGGIIQIKLL